jgi:HlyD family secretion protein
MLRKRGFWTVVIVLALALGGGYYYYSNVYAHEQTLDEPTVKTAKVRTGDLTVTASGAGTLVPAAEINLAFRSGGLLTEVMLQVGDKVQAGDVLARLDGTDAHKTLAAAELQVAQAEANLNAQQDLAAVQQAVVRAKVQVAQAEANLSEAQIKLQELLNWTPDEGAVTLAQANLDAAQADYEEVATRADQVGDQLTVVRVNLEQARSQLEAAQAAYDVAFEPARDWELYDRKLGPKLESERVSAERNLEKAQADLQIAQANYNLATIGVNDSDRLNTWLKVLNAQAALEDAQTGPEEADIAAAGLQVEQLELALTQAQLDLASAQDPDLTQLELALAQAQLNLDAAQQALAQLALIAPVDGTVLAIAAQAGESISTNPLITLADMSQPLVEIYMDETDLNRIAVGYEVQVVFDALQDEVFVGHVVQVDPVLVTVDGVSAVRGLALLDEASFAKPQSLPVGLRAAVELIGGRAEDALLVPVEALRELAPGEYAVFVMEDGEPKLRMVEVGLMDFTYAEITSGVEQGDIVSTGIVETE